MEWVRSAWEAEKDETESRELGATGQELDQEPLERGKDPREKKKEKDGTRE